MGEGEAKARGNAASKPQDYLVWLEDLVVVWSCKTVVLIQDNGPNVGLSAVRRKCLVERDGEVVEGCDSGVRKTQRWLC